MPPERIRNQLKRGSLESWERDPVPSGTFGQSRGRERGQGGGKAYTEPELLCPHGFVQRILERGKDIL